ncbi:dockerin type I repeat-containing protein [Botrimarina sp.]|uniref:beta strand repeat-containing protein n=1 Tax=Botrimarina sp. TaxID=2795802 RepID=UPI0032ED3981
MRSVTDFWRAARRALARQAPARRHRPLSRPLRVYRLERRRMLSASFSLTGASLVIDGLGDGGSDSLSVSESGGFYRFDLGGDSWNVGGSLAPGVSVDGGVLSIDKPLLDAAPDGLSIVGIGESSLDVTLGEVDFSGMAGPVQIIGATSINQPTGATVAAPSFRAFSFTAPALGATVGDLTVVGSLQVIARGPISDTPGAQITITGNATFLSLRDLPDADFDSSGVVDQADYDLWAAGRGVQSGADRADGDANGDGRVDAADYTLWRDSLGERAIDGGITLADNPGDVLSVGGRARFEARAELDPSASPLRYDVAVGGPSGGVVELGSLSFQARDVAVHETAGDGLRLEGENTSRALWLVSDGGITDAPGTSVEHTGGASLESEGSIVLADTPSDVFAWTGSFRAAPTGVGTSFAASAVQVGVGGTFSSTTLTFNAEGTVEVVERARPGSPAGALGSMTLAGASTAGELELTSGSITDVAGAQVVVAGPAMFTADSNVLLADAPGESLIVARNADPAVATFRAGQVDLGRGGLFAADALNFTADLVTVNEGVSGADARPGTRLVGINSAGSLTVATAGPLTDTGTTQVSVNGAAAFSAEGAISLAGGASPANSLTVGSNVSFVSGGSNPSIRVGVDAAGENAGATTSFGSLRFNAPDGSVAIAEDDATLLSAASSAAGLTLRSAGAIDDATGSSITVSGGASLFAGGAIALADTQGDLLTVGGRVRLDGSSIAVGGEGVFSAGALWFQSPNSVSVRESSPARDPLPGTELVASSTAGDLVLISAGPITDSPDASLVVTGDATLSAVGSITLADDDAFGTDNLLAVAGRAAFSVTGSAPTIDIGVTPVGLPARAVAQFGSLSFDAAGGSVRIAEDTGLEFGGAAPGTLLEGQSAAATLELTTDGDLTDAPDALTAVTTSAVLAAAGSDILLGDAGAVFDLGDPAPLDSTRFLALVAMNVSIVAAGAVNLRTGATDPALTGVLYLRASGTVSQVPGADGQLTPLAAERIAIQSDAGAVLLRRVSLAADEGPNLALHAGGGFDIAGLPAEGPGAFPLELIPGDATTPFSPIAVEPRGTSTPRPDGSGLEDLSGAVVQRGAAIGDLYGVVAVVEGDATVGLVQDSTATQPDLLGLEVGAANAFLQTLAAPDSPEPGDLLFTAGGPGPAAPDGVVVRTAGGVFTALAAGELTIDTAAPDTMDPGALLTTRLVSATGVVTSVDPFVTVNGITGQAFVDSGPRFVLDPPDDGADAATTGLVLAGTNFEQRVTAGIGSRGEDNLIVVLDWADVANPLQPGVPASRVAFTTALPGSVALPGVTLAPESLDAAAPSPGLTQQSSPEIDFRVATIRYNYADVFIPANPLQDSLPTAITVFNDPAINLYDNVTAPTDGQPPAFRNLNLSVNAVEPDIRAVEGYTLPIPRDEPTARRLPQPTPIPTAETPSVERRVEFGERSVNIATVEVILYGRVDPNDPDQWATDVPGEVWPQQWEGPVDADASDQDFIREIRELIDNGPYSEGRYRIVIETPRGVQPLEEWVKGDLDPEDQQTAPETQPEETPRQPQDQAPAAPAPAEGDQGAADGKTGGAVAAASLWLAASRGPAGRLKSRWRRYAEATGANDSEGAR